MLEVATKRTVHKPFI